MYHSRAGTLRQHALSLRQLRITNVKAEQHARTICCDYRRQSGNMITVRTRVRRSPVFLAFRESRQSTNMPHTREHLHTTCQRNGDIRNEPKESDELRLKHTRSFDRDTQRLRRMAIWKRIFDEDPYNALFGPSNEALKGRGWRHPLWDSVPQWMQEEFGVVQDLSTEKSQIVSPTSKSQPDIQGQPQEDCKKSEMQYKNDTQAMKAFEYDPVTGKMVPRRSVSQTNQNHASTKSEKNKEKLSANRDRERQSSKSLPKEMRTEKAKQPRLESSSADERNPEKTLESSLPYNNRPVAFSDSAYTLSVSLEQWYRAQQHRLDVLKDLIYILEQQIQMDPGLELARIDDKKEELSSRIRFLRSGLVSQEGGDAVSKIATEVLSQQASSLDAPAAQAIVHAWSNLVKISASVQTEVENLRARLDRCERNLLESPRGTAFSGRESFDIQEMARLVTFQPEKPRTKDRPRNFDRPMRDISSEMEDSFTDGIKSGLKKRLEKYNTKAPEANVVDATRTSVDAQGLDSNGALRNVRCEEPESEIKKDCLSNDLNDEKTAKHTPPPQSPSDKVTAPGPVSDMYKARFAYLDNEEIPESASDPRARRYQVNDEPLPISRVNEAKADMLAAGSPVSNEAQAQTSAFVPETAKEATPQPLTYKILAYDPSTKEVTVSVISTTHSAENEAIIPLPQAIVRLHFPSKFLPHIGSKYDVVAVHPNLMILRRPCAAASADPVSDESSTESFPYVHSVNPIDGTTVPLPQPTSGNFASPTDFVSFDQPSYLPAPATPLSSSSSPLPYQATHPSPDHSDPAAQGKSPRERTQDAHPQSQSQRSRGGGVASVFKAAIGGATICYVAGVLAELAQLG